MLNDRELERLRPELVRQAAALYVAANEFSRHLFDSPGHGQRALLETHAGLVFGRQLSRFRTFLCGVAPEWAGIIEQIAAGDDLFAQLEALPELRKAPPADVPGQQVLFEGDDPAGCMALALRQAEGGQP